jgi:hypothetical protein
MKNNDRNKANFLKLVNKTIEFEFKTISIDEKLLELKEIIANNAHDLPDNGTKPESHTNTPTSK